ncbi:hypothetical protein ALC53_08050 [Atta colombica]|uniref:Uncharacterized protein n=1 Tax=Atta colombica TaxID=520822 RepID=A0A151I2Q4_9HYME|nr:hypothetical protein ALC53_08050 [Atta colombica]
MRISQRPSPITGGGKLAGNSSADLTQENRFPAKDACRWLFFSPARRFRDEREDRKKKAGVRSSRLYETSNERVPKERELSVKCACFPVFELIIDLNTEKKGAGKQEKKFAANGVSLMNAFFVSGKQRGPGPILPGSCAVR